MKNFLKRPKTNRKNKKGSLLLFFYFFFTLICALAFYLFTRNLFLAFSITLILMMTFFFLYNRSRQIEEKVKNKKIYAAVQFFSYFSIYVQTGLTVYESLKRAFYLADENIKEEITPFLASFNEDKSLTPYLELGNRFASPEVKQLLLSIYRLEEEGGSGNALSHFLNSFSALEEMKGEEKLLETKESFSSFSFLPLLASGLALIMVVIGIVEILGGFLNGF